MPPETTVNTKLPDAVVIPVTDPSIDDLKRQYELAVSDTGCHFYIDTSILVWLTQISKAARAEFSSWIDGVGSDRFHVPVWAAHEFFNHHVNDLIGRKLSDAADRMRKAADEVYRDIRPFLAEPIDDRTPAEWHLNARDVLVQLKGLAQDVGRWKQKHYSQHLQEVADLVGRLGLRHRPGIVEFMSDIDVLQRNRYSGRIPPGFKDKNKKQRVVEQAETDRGAVTAGDNRYGDLMFWREILEHASSDNAIVGIVIISNDGKNDWRMGAGRSPEEDDDMMELRRGWPPLPSVHPMLRYEANYRAGVDTLLIVDCEYLALLLRKTGVESAQLVEAAIGIRLPEPKADFKDKRKSKVREAMVKAGHKSNASESGMSSANPYALVRAARQKRLSERAAASLDLVFETANDQPVLEQVETLLAAATTDDLVQFGRTIHSRAVDGQSLAVSKLADLVIALADLPTKTAACLYFGILVSVYFDERNAARVPPAPLALEEILRMQAQEFATPGMDALELRFKSEQKRSPFVIDRAKMRLKLEVLTRDVALSEHPLLSSLQIDGIELVTLAQSDEAMLFKTLFPGRTTVMLREIADAAAKIFGVLPSLLDLSDKPDRQLSFDERTGFEMPQSILIQREAADA